MSKTNDLLFKIALTHIPKVGTVTARNLVSFCGGSEAVFHQKKSHLLKIPGIGPAVADNIINKRSFVDAENELLFIEKNKVKALFYLDKEYPIRLKRIKDAPVILYYKGNADLNHSRIVSIVGTRKPTVYGVSQCEKLVNDLKSFDVLILSGLAYGIDITAHRRSLQVGVPTVGVLGSGLDRLYPSAHRKAAHDMVANGGLLTEFGRGTKPDRENFPMRNRIIAGMSDALVVIESDIRGGSMITAEMGNGYHKDVFALPGRVGDQWSRGCNFLIKTNKAHLFENGEELALVMQWKGEGSGPIVQASLFEDLSKEELCICEVLRDTDQVCIDRIYKEVNSLSVSQVASALLGLEFKGLIKSLPGKMYMLT